MKKLLFLLILLTLPRYVEGAACSSTAVGTFTCIQSYEEHKTASTGPAYTITNNIVGSSSILVGMIEWSSPTGTLNSVTGSGAGCSSATIVLYDNPTNMAGNDAWRTAGFSARGLAAGTCTLTLSLSVSVVSELTAHELSGAVNNADPVSTRHALNNQNHIGTATDAITAGPVTTAGTDYIFGASIDCDNTSTINAGTNYNPRVGTNNSGSGCWVSTEDKSTNGSVTVTFTDTNANQANFTLILSVAAVASFTPRQMLLGCCDLAHIEMKPTIGKLYSPEFPIVALLCLPVVLAVRRR